MYLVAIFNHFQYLYIRIKFFICVLHRPEITPQVVLWGDNKNFHHQYHHHRHQCPSIGVNGQDTPREVAASC